MTETGRRGEADAGAERIDYGVLVGHAKGEARKVALAAGWILQEFDAYYIESRGIPEQAQAAFEARDHGTSLALSRRRLSIYSESIHALAPALVAALPYLAESERLWRAVEEIYLPLISGRYEADLAFAYINSVRRVIHRDEWRPVAYAFRDSAGGATEGATESAAQITRRFAGGPRLAPGTVRDMLGIPGFVRHYRDAEDDAFLIAERVNEALGLDGRDRARTADAIREIEMIDAGFYRNRGVYLVGRLRLASGAETPLVIALLNDADGIYADAVLTSEADVHNIFSSTLANFHITNPHYHELAAFLRDIMPNRALGLHYSTIGFNHVGKVAVMTELEREMAASGEVFEPAVGFRGTVAIGFSTPASAYVLKVIRDQPTAQYKWGAFEGVGAVLAKYRRIHEINRTGSMLDNIIYYNLRLDRDWFDPALLDELLREAGNSVSLIGGAVVLKHLIIQPKMIPLPVFLETASRTEAESAVTALGHCIKNNAAANVFNKDLDGRNYGVSAHRMVYLFDYDALEPFTEIKIRTNADRIEGEEEVPDWFFEDGVIFLPEEIESGLRIPDRELVRHFRRVHGDLMGTDYWERVQRDLREGQVPSISIYPEERRLVRDITRLGAYH
jgi:isocitrate dehydrogenase kinase/phosphatase